MSNSSVENSVQFDLLVEALEDIALQAHSHRASTAYNGGENIALVNIRNIALIALEKVASETRQTITMKSLSHF